MRGARPRAAAPASPGAEAAAERHRGVTGASLRATALRMLARREHARAELEARLLRRGAEAADVAAVLDALERDGYLSDARFAQGLVTQRAGRYGKRAIAHALRERGVDRTIAREALDGLAGRDELAEAIALLARRFSGPPRDDRERVRRIRFLIARGYDASVARRAEADAERDTPGRE